MKYVEPNTISEPTRSIFLNARDGDVLPPMAAPAGIGIYAVCGRHSRSWQSARLRGLPQDARIIFRKRPLRLLSGAHLAIATEC